MSLEEFQMWVAFDAETPLPDLRADFNAANIVSSVVNMSGKAVKKPVKVSDCLLFTRPAEHKPVDVLEQLKNAKARN